MTTRLVAFEDRQGHFIFVKVPEEYGRYVRTHLAVAFVPCGCGADVGVPCKGQYGRYTGSIHADRIINAKNFLAAEGVRYGRGKRAVGEDEGQVAPQDTINDEDEPGIIDAPTQPKTEPPIIDLREFFK